MQFESFWMALGVWGSAAYYSHHGIVKMVSQHIEGLHPLAELLK